MDFLKLARTFILNDGKKPKPTLKAHVKALSEDIVNIKPATEEDKKRLESARMKLTAIRKLAK